jgi:hypothetical protein
LRSLSWLLCRLEFFRTLASRIPRYAALSSPRHWPSMASVRLEKPDELMPARQPKWLTSFKI